MWSLSSRKTAVVLTLFAWCALTGPVQSPAAEDLKKDRSLELAELLNTSVKFGGLDDPKTTLAEGIVQLNLRYGLALTVNTRAFEAEWEKEQKKPEKVMFEKNVLKSEIAHPPMPEMPKVRLGTLVKMLLARLPSPSGATYLIRKDVIEITTMTALREELKRADGRLPPLIYARFEKRPLEQVLRQLADGTEVSVVIDAHAGENGKILVSAALKGVPLDTAVRMLADMADLEPVVLGNAIYVTTREKAAHLIDREKQKRKQLLISK